MAKTNKAQTEEKDFTPLEMPERMKRRAKGEKDISFFHFEVKVPAVFTRIQEDKLEHKVFKVLEATTGDEYYLPAHDKIVELFEGEDPNGYFEITFLGKRKFKDGKKEYNSYDTYILEK